MQNAAVKLTNALAGSPQGSAVIRSLRALAVRSLVRMYRSEDKSFVFCLRRTSAGIRPEGSSPRYTAITLIGLATESQETVAQILGSDSLRDVCGHLAAQAPQMTNLGDVALTLWAACAVGLPDRQPLLQRLLELQPGEKSYPTVEVSWALAALCFAADLPGQDDMRKRLAERLMAAYGKQSAIFPHVLGAPEGGGRSHVSCFADLVYPVHALSQYGKLTGNREALETALGCAVFFCRQQGPAGQWWWHYDWRTGDIIEPYPVYAVHQDAMAPMALFAVAEATQANFTAAVQKGLDWLVQAPELDGGSLIDTEADLIWRKVARHEPAKLSRYIQAAASRVHTRLRAPGLSKVFPAGAIDYEDRPYHLGWLFYAWPPSRVAKWEQEEQGT
jgi:hypothetical protein